MGLRIVLLGRLGIDSGHGPISTAGLSGRRSEVVFAYLAAEHRRCVSRDELADELWPEQLPDSWSAALRTVLSDVRRFVEAAGLDPAQTLVAEQGELRLRLPDDAVVDIDEVRAALARAREQLAAGEAAAAAAAAGPAAEQAALPFLSHHEGQWADAIRRELDELHVGALEIQVHALRQAGDGRAAVAASDRLVRADPFSEQAHRLRIEILGEAGDRAGARKAYEHYRTLLLSELGIGPSADVEAALERVLGPAPAPAREPPVAGFGALSVLVVEDHGFQRRVALRLLSGLGVGTLYEAADGAAAIALLETSAAPDIIVCDIDMPGMDGVEFIRHVADRQLASAVVIASGLDERLLETVRAASEGYGLQVLGAVSKPLTAAALEQLLGAYRPPPPPPPPSAQASLAAAVGAALDRGTLAAEFEPVVDLANGAVHAVRVAAHWPSASAGGFLAAVDAAGLSQRLTEHLLRRARDEVADLDVDAWLRLPSSLMADVSLADALAAITRNRIVLIVGASALTRGDNPGLLSMLARLRVKGYGLCVDGFEAGRGPLARVPLTHAELPAHVVATAAATADSAQLSQLAQALGAARSLNVPVGGRCASAAEFDVLLQLGCSFAHGPFLAAPLPGAQLAAGIRDWEMPPAVSDRAP